LISDVSTATRKEEEQPAVRRALVEVGITKAFVVVVNASNDAITETRSSNIRLVIMVLPIKVGRGCDKGMVVALLVDVPDVEEDVIRAFRSQFIKDMGSYRFFYYYWASKGEAPNGNYQPRIRKSDPSQHGLEP
jgi:hypothetical protein